jgi:hypothetical protein
VQFCLGDDELRQTAASTMQGLRRSARLLRLSVEAEDVASAIFVSWCFGSLRVLTTAWRRRRGEDDGEPGLWLRSRRRWRWW